MRHRWVIATIEGLRDYARLNGLRKLAEALDEARLIALIETAEEEGRQEPAAPTPPKSAREPAAVRLNPNPKAKDHAPDDPEPGDH